MLINTDENKFSVPPKTAFAYQNFKPISETASYRIFNAETKKTHEKHLIKILDPTKDLVAYSFDLAATLFIQELFHLQNRCPGSVLFNTLEINLNRKQVACAIRPHDLSNLQLDKIQERIDLKNPEVIEKLLNGVLLDIEFLWKGLQMKNIASILEPENIYYLKETEDFFLGNWGKIIEKGTLDQPEDDLTATTVISGESELKSQDLAREIKTLGFALLEMKGINYASLKQLQEMPDLNPVVYDVAVKTTLGDSFKDSDKLQNLIERMLSRELHNLPNLEEFRINKSEPQISAEEVKKEVEGEEQKIEICDQIDGLKTAFSETWVMGNSWLLSLNYFLIFRLESADSKLLAWCSLLNNKINIAEFESKQSYAEFDGVKISDAGKI